MREYLELQDAIAALREALTYAEIEELYRVAGNAVNAFDKFEESRKPHGSIVEPSFVWSEQ